MASASSPKVIFAALAGSGLIALTKLIAFGLTGSAARLFEGAAWYFALTEFARAKGKWGYLKAVQCGKDPALFGVLFEDSAALLGLIVARVGIFLCQITGNPIYDGPAAVVIGLILAATAAWLAYETKSLLI